VKVSLAKDSIYALEGDLNRNTVTHCWPQALADLKQLAAKHKPVVDMQAVTQVDTAALAWLLNLIRDCRGQNIEFTLANVPKTLINLAKISDAEAFLPLQ
jgi:phospholipid transport system transporter-binding protein